MYCERPQFTRLSRINILDRTQSSVDLLDFEELTFFFSRLFYYSNNVKWVSIPFAMLNPAVKSISPSSVDWIGYVDPQYYGQYFDYGMLLIFGGIPWQVSRILNHLN
jgi:hypothetical protein